jgi:phage shock protein B
VDPEFIFIPLFFIGLPWLILHYVTKWKTAATITSDDEVLLEELYNLAKRLDERMDTVERLVASDDPSFTPLKRLQSDQESDNQQLRELEMMMQEKKGTKS